MAKVNGWAVFSVWDSGCWDDPQARYVEAFLDKGNARKRIKWLLRGCEGFRKPTDYQIRRVRLNRGRFFERRALPWRSTQAKG